MAHTRVRGILPEDGLQSGVRTGHGRLPIADADNMCTLNKLRKRLRWGRGARWIFIAAACLLLTRKTISYFRSTTLTQISSKSDLLRRKCIVWEEQLSSAYLAAFGSSKLEDIYLKADIMADHENKFFFCKVPKAASTSWVDTLLPRFGYDIKRIFIGWRHKLLRKHMPQPANANNVSGYFSFVTVRHPFQKLVSAYSDKFFAHANEFSEMHKASRFEGLYSNLIVSRYRHSNVNSSSVSPGSAPNFAEFVEYLIDTDVSQFNEHWYPMYLMCLPCRYNYSVVSSIETLSADSADILRHLTKIITTKKRLLLPRLHATAGEASNKTQSKAKLYFSQITKQQVKKLYDKYFFDFELFGYHIEPYLSYAKD